MIKGGQNSKRGKKVMIKGEQMEKIMVQERKDDKNDGNTLKKITDNGKRKNEKIMIKGAKKG